MQAVFMEGVAALQAIKDTFHQMILVMNDITTLLKQNHCSCPPVETIEKDTSTIIKDTTTISDSQVLVTTQTLLYQPDVDMK